MANKSDVIVDDHIKPYLDEISERLLSGHAALMVGSGFSKNAIPKSGATKKFPNWNELGDIFHEKSTGYKPRGQDSYLNPLKLAEEVEALFGRPVLEDLLKNSIPDDSYQPTKLFEKLLRLPWKDVFTTNYDTLLERAADNITDRNYQIVVSKEDLISSSSPRIIKLHGSFPSHTPFIITEEDYRTYPKKFAPLVNTVQQSLLENTLCLIGFSGDDPNFLNWIGWIRDHFESDNKSKIYMICLTDLSEPQKKLLNKRNVNIINLQGRSGMISDHETAIEKFVDYLTSKKESEDRLNWPKKIYWPSDSTEDKRAVLEKIITRWKETREAFPGWRIVPNEVRKFKISLLLNNAREWINYISDELDNIKQIDIFFVYEYCWLLEKFLVPIPDDMAKLAGRCLAKYQPTLSVSIADDDTSANSDWNSVKAQWVQISIYMLRYCRENGKFEKWDEYESNLSNIGWLTDEQVAAIHYERALKHFFQLDLPSLELCLNDWPTNQSLPFSEAKRAGLLAEIGRLADAQDILELSLQTVRKKQNLRPVYKDYTDVSDEAYLMLLLRCVEQSSLLTTNNYSGYSELKEKHSERFNFLHQFKCSPLEELSLFSTKLESAFVEHREVTQDHSFRIGTVNTRRHFLSINYEALVAYSFLRFCEDAGLPFHLPKLNIAEKSAQGSLERIGIYSSHWALITLLRTGNRKVVEQIYNRKYVFQLTVEQCDEVVNRLLITFENVKSDIYSETSVYPIIFGANLAKIIPVIFARLCCKVSSRTKERLIDFLVEVYSSNHKSKFDGIRNFVQQLFDSMSNEHQYRSIPKLLEISIPEFFHPRVENDYPNPFICLRNSISTSESQKSISIQRDRISYFIEKVQSKEQKVRDWSINILGRLDQLNLLTKAQRNRFIRVVWRQTDKHGFPSNSIVLKHFWLKYQVHEDNHVGNLLEAYISSLQIPHQAYSTTVVFDSKSYIDMINELVGTQKEIDTDKISAFDPNVYLQWLIKVLSWWETNKPNFQLQFNDERDEEFQARIHYLIGILSEFTLPNLTSTSLETIKQKIKIFVTELRSHNIPTAYINTATIELLDHDKKEVIYEIRQQLTAEDRFAVVDAIRALFVVMENKNSIFNLEDQHFLMRFVLYSIIWRSNETITDALDVISRIVTQYSHLVNREIEKLVTLALRVTVEFSDLESESTTKEFGDKLTVRKGAAHLAYNLYLFCEKRKKEIPQELLAWKSICSCEEEFSEIRIQWGES